MPMSIVARGSPYCGSCLFVRQAVIMGNGRGFVAWLRWKEDSVISLSK